MALASSCGRLNWTLFQIPKQRQHRTGLGWAVGPDTQEVRCAAVAGEATAAATQVEQVWESLPFPTLPPGHRQPWLRKCHSQPETDGGQQVGPVFELGKGMASPGERGLSSCVRNCTGIVVHHEEAGRLVTEESRQSGTRSWTAGEGTRASPKSQCNILSFQRKHQSSQWSRVGEKLSRAQ